MFAESPIQIKAGSEGKTFYVHPGVFTPFPSSALYARIHGPWKDSSDGILDLTEFDEYTIECCLSYFYKRDYCPYQVAPKSDPELGNGVKDEGSGSTEKESQDSSYTDPKAGNEQEQPAQTSASSDSPLEPIENMVELRPRATLKTQDPSGNSQALIMEALVHARVYSFAHMYLFSELETFALRRLGKTLIALRRHKISMPLQLADAVRVIYGATPNASYNPARELLSRFIAQNFSSLLGECLDNLLQEGGDFAVDVSRKLARDCPPKIKDQLTTFKVAASISDKTTSAPFTFSTRNTARH